MVEKLIKKNIMDELSTRPGGTPSLEEILLAGCRSERDRELVAESLAARLKITALEMEASGRRQGLEIAAGLIAGVLKRNKGIKK